MPPAEARVRPWVKWIVGGTWLVTAVVVLILFQTHLPTSATITIHTREVSLGTDVTAMLNSADQTQLTVSGPAQFKIIVGSDKQDKPAKEDAEVIDAPNAASSCSFYQVHTEPLHLVDMGKEKPGDRRITLLWPQHSDADLVALRVRQNTRGSLTGNAAPGRSTSFLCSGIAPSGPRGDIFQGTLSGDAETTFQTLGDAQITFHEASSESLEGNMAVTGSVRIEHVDPIDGGQTIATLLDPPSAGKNQIVFDSFARTVSLNKTDLVEISPGKDLYVTNLTVNNGIGLQMHGTVNEVRVGAGTNNLRSYMPSVLDLLTSKQRVFGSIPSAVAFILGIFEAMGLLPKKKKETT